MKKIERILAIAPHTDDVELGCGGSIAKFIEKGTEVYYCALSIAEKSVPPIYPSNILEIEVREACQVLGIPINNMIIYKYEVRKLNYFRQEILEEFVKLNREIKPDLVFIPSSDDVHQDHNTVHLEGIRAFRNASILCYELPWNQIRTTNTAFISLNEKHLNKKIQSIKCYKSQNKRPYMNEEFIKGWAKLRGVQIKKDYAEAMEVVRWII